MKTFTKDPDATLDYTMDWTLWLNDVSDTIQSSTWIVDDGVTIENQSNDTLSCTIWLSGGVVDSVYTITNRINTVGGRIDDRSFYLKISNK